MSTLKWEGPYTGGITQSLIGKFLECPYRFYLYAGLGLEEPREDNLNLIWGNGAHYAFEQIIKDPIKLKEWEPEKWAELDQGIWDYFDKFYPNRPETFPYSVQRMARLYDDRFKDECESGFRTEVPFVFNHKTSSGISVVLRGKADGLSMDNRILVEHKCKGKIDGPQSRGETPVDLQCNLYAYTSGARKVIYDLIRIPDTQWGLPPKRVGQRIANYVQDIYQTRTYKDYPINANRYSWLYSFTTELTDKGIFEEFIPKTLDPLIERICAWYEHVTQPGFDHNNPKYYNHLFYKTPVRHFDPSKTEYYKCNYWNLLVGEIDESCLTPVSSYYKELDEA